VYSTLMHLQVRLSLCCRAHTTSERSLEAVEPFPNLASAKSSKEERAVSRHDHTDPPTGGVLSTTSHPTPPPITRRAVCTKVDTASGGKSTRSLGAESEHSPSPSRSTGLSGKRPDRIFPRQAFSSNQKVSLPPEHVKEEHTQNAC
jgi:hypothetical protein